MQNAPLIFHVNGIELTVSIEGKGSYREGAVILLGTARRGQRKTYRLGTDQGTKVLATHCRALEGSHIQTFGTVSMADALLKAEVRAHDS